MSTITLNSLINIRLSSYIFTPLRQQSFYFRFIIIINCNFSLFSMQNMSFYDFICYLGFQWMCLKDTWKVSSVYYWIIQTPHYMARLYAMTTSIPQLKSAVLLSRFSLLHNSWRHFLNGKSKGIYPNFINSVLISIYIANFVFCFYPI